MKVCSKCNSSNKDDSLFCSKCGSKFKKEVDLGKIVLLVGVFLVMFSSIFFGILNWENMANLFRLLFFCFETCLFYLMALALKKVSNKTARIFFVIGLILTPFTLSMIPYYNLVPSILYNESLIYVYLAIVYLLTFVGYLLVNIKFKGKILNYLSLISLLLSVICFTGIFTENIAILGLVITIFMFIVSLCSKFLKNNNRIYYIFSLVLSFFVVPFLVVCFFQAERFEMVINCVTMLVFMAYTYTNMIFNKETILHFFAPFMLQLLTFVLIGSLGGTHTTLIILAVVLVNIALYFITLIFKNSMFSITTLVLTYVMIAFLSLFCMITVNYMNLVIISAISLVFNLVLVIVKKYNFAHFLITINVLTLVIGLNSWLYSFSSLIISGFLLILYLIIYLVLNLINNKYDFVYLIIMMLVGFVTVLIMADDLSGFSIIRLIICTTFVIGFILINIFKENVAIRVIWFILLNLLILPLFSAAYYSLLTIAILTIILSAVLSKTTSFNFKPHFLFAEIVIFIITLFNTMDYNLYSLFVNVIAYILGYLCLTKFHNKKAWKIAFVMAGLLFIIRLIGVVIDPRVIASLVSILLVLIIITSMYLLDTFNSKELVIISLVVLVPYYALVSSLFGPSIYGWYEWYEPEALKELNLLPFIVYSIVLLFVIKWKNTTNRNIFILIPYFLFAVILLFCNSGVVSTIIDAIFAVTYMIIALIKKYNLLLFFSIGLLIAFILFHIFTVLNSMMAIIALLIIGFILIFVAVLYSTKKKD